MSATTSTTTLLTTEAGAVVTTETGAPVSVAAAPAPTAVTALSAQPGPPASGTVTLQWTAPAVTATNGPAASYTVYYSLAGLVSYTLAARVTGTSAVVTGLTQGAWYDFAVYALNGGGRSAGKVAIAKTA